MAELPEFSKIKALILDSDGILTDGGVYISSNGQDMRRFDIKDGLGLVRLQKMGIPVAIISASPATPVLERAKTLGIMHAYVGEKDKLSRAKAILEEWEIPPAEAAFMGDDLADRSLLQWVGFPITVADASPVIQKANYICYITRANGGHGAVREVCDLILGPELATDEPLPPSI
ncbi:MAG: HAD-IIIA family hydrolase [Verrucomicrobiota bacterium]